VLTKSKLPIKGAVHSPKPKNNRVEPPKEISAVETTACWCSFS